MTTQKTAKASGNTTSSADYRKGRNFIMTIQESQYEMLPNIIKYVENLACFQYVLITEHDKEDTGEMRKHRHMYLQLTECRVLAKKVFETIHIEKCLGSAQQNYDYLMCLDDKHKKLNVVAEKVYENGTMLLRGGQTVKDAINMTEDELLIQNRREYRIIRQIKTEYAHKPTKFTETYKPDIEIIYICGTSDLGKTKWIYDFMKTKGDDEPLSDTIYYDGKYWNNINEGIEWAIYDEWRDWHMKPTEFLKLIDFYIKDLRVLYGFTKNKYKHIIITTIQDLQEIYLKSGENPLQWYKRITRYVNLNTGEDMTGREKYKIDFKDNHQEAQDDI